ncbi:MAG: LacI family DNA-binding transcriptional regulator [Akkermansiaceae bacterium]
MKLKDIAELVGYSQATVSNAINGRGRMSDEVRKEILAKCTEFNFVPNSAGRSLRLRRADAVGVIYAPSFAELFGNVFYARIMEGLAEVFGEVGLDLILGNRTDSDGMPSVVRQGKVDALVVLAGVFDTKTYKVLQDCPVPVCVVDGNAGLPNADTLTSDGYNGARLVAEHFAEYGHRHLVMVAYDSELYNIEQRIAGFLSGLRQAGLPANEGDAVIRVKDNVEAIEQVTKRLSGEDSPTGLFAINDTLACYLVDELTRKGYQIPSDLSVIGFDNDPFAESCRPPLTTVGLDKREFGLLSARMVVDRLADADRIPSHRVQPTRLISRDSVCSPRKARQ